MRNFWYMYRTKSFILMDRWASKVSIKSTIFRNFHFVDGIITNIQYPFHKIFTHNKNALDKFTCKHFNSSLGACHSVTIQGSTFSGYLPYKVNMLTGTIAINRGLAPSRGVEAFIMRVRSLDGPITITESTFKNIITLKREFFNTDALKTASHCTGGRVSTSMTDIVSLENVARIVRRASMLFKQLASLTSVSSQSLSISSCFDIRELKQGLVMYKNTFQKIYGTTAPVLHLYGFENTLSNYFSQKPLCLIEYFAFSISDHHRQQRNSE